MKRITIAWAKLIAILNQPLREDTWDCDLANEYLCNWKSTTEAGQ